MQRMIVRKNLNFQLFSYPQIFCVRISIFCFMRTYNLPLQIVSNDVEINLFDDKHRVHAFDFRYFFEVALIFFRTLFDDISTCELL